MYVKARVVLRGFKRSKELVALVDTGVSTTVVDSSLADEVGVEFTGRERVLAMASGHRLVRLLLLRSLLLRVRLWIMRGF